MNSLNVDFLLFDIAICTNEIFKAPGTVKGLRKSETKEFLSLPTKDSHLNFAGTVHKQINQVAKGSSLGPTLVNGFSVYHEKNN